MTAARFFLAFVALLVLALVAAAVLLVRIPPDKIGVKQNLLGEGVVPQDFGIGFGLRVPGVHKWHFLDRRTHFLTFSREGIETAAGEQQPALEVRTKDNNLATFDLTVTYKIIENEGHKLVEEGKHVVYRDRLQATVESVLREELAQLSSEDIYSTDMRLEVAEGARPRLAAAMAEYHVQPESILIRAVNFPAIYERKLQEKQLTYQRKKLEEARRVVEDEQAKTEGYSAEIAAAEKQLNADWDKRLQQATSDNLVAIRGILAEAEVYDKRVRAEAERDYTVLVAEGQLALEKAEALRAELRNQALDTVGGRIYLAREAAENLHFDSVTLNSNDASVPTILDIDELTRLLIGAE